MERVPVANRKFVKNLAIIEKHLDKNEKWLQHPEKKMNEFEADIRKWDKNFIEDIQQLERVMIEFDKIMD